MDALGDNMGESPTSVKIFNAPTGDRYPFVPPVYPFG